MTCTPPLNLASPERGGRTLCPGQSMRVADLPQPVAALDGRHPCFSSGESHPRTGRLHLPVSPGCNLSCAFCRRSFNDAEHRPGVAHGLIRPEQAADAVGRALALCPDISVVGIAGPGDPLATDHAIRTFELIHARFPDLIKCVSTNGLALPEKAGRLLSAGVRSVTVTVNAVDPAIAAAIVPRIAHGGRVIKGEAAAAILIEKQIEGIRLVASGGAAIKINTVLVPGVNDGHVETVARTVAAAGASLVNIIPLIPEHAFAHLAPPPPAMVSQAREEAGRHLPVFSHCQRCRADACGIPGVSDVSAALWGVAGLDFGQATFSHG